MTPKTNAVRAAKASRKALMREIKGLPTETKKRQPIRKVKPRTAKQKKEKVPSVAVLDDLFSRYIRARAANDCQLAGYGGVQCSTQIQCSHIISRKYNSTRWHPLNALSVCASHHHAQHNHPYQNSQWLDAVVGAEEIMGLYAYWNEARKPTDDEKREIAKWLRIALAAIERAEAVSASPWECAKAA